MEHPSRHETGRISQSVQSLQSISSRWSSARHAKRCCSPIMFTLWRNELLLFCFILLDEYRGDIILRSHWHRWKSPVCYPWTQSCSYGVAGVFNISLFWWSTGVRCLRYQPSSCRPEEISQCCEGQISLSNGGRRRYCLYSTDVVASSCVKVFNRVVIKLIVQNYFMSLMIKLIIIVCPCLCNIIYSWLIYPHLDLNVNRLLPCGGNLSLLSKSLGESHFLNSLKISTMVSSETGHVTYKMYICSLQLFKFGFVLEFFTEFKAEGK